MANNRNRNQGNGGNGGGNGRGKKRKAGTNELAGVSFNFFPYEYRCRKIG